MECTAEKNAAACTCTYDCERRGKCYECVAFHRGMGQVPGCFFSREAERTPGNLSGAYPDISVVSRIELVYKSIDRD
jgi:hypothetical protein